MKKILFALFAAVCCLTSCVSSETESVYLIRLGSVSYSESISSAGSAESAALIKECQKAFSEFTTKYSSEWEWRVVVKNYKYGSSDAEAIKKFNKYSTELQALAKTYQAKFDACSDTHNMYESVQALTLKRVSEDSAELAREEVSVIFN